jgi:L-ribulose-5-phosphate 3-epimerase
LHPSADEAKSRVLFEAAKRMGIDTIVCEPECKSMADLPHVMDVVEKLAVEYNIKVAIHEHPKPNFYWNPETVLFAVKGRSPLLGACADVGHWKRSGLNPVECLKILQGRIIALHFKDLVKGSAPTANGLHDVPWGTGTSDARGMLEELKRQHFHGAICIEYEYHWENSSPEIAKSVKWFNDTCAELVKEPATP